MPADALRERAEALLVAGRYGADPVASARSRDLQVMLEDVDAALARIVAGTYGDCVQCGRAIPVERLTLRPFAAGCVSCAGSHRQ